MNDLFKKLNTLVRANVHHVLDDALSTVRNLAPERAAQDLDVQVRTLRARINDALDHEDTLVAQVAQLSDEVARWDAEADAAVDRGDDEQARWCIAQMQRTQHLLGFAEADLRAHRHVTQELIVRVNQLEASVADVRAQREGHAGATPSTGTRPMPPQQAAPSNSTPRAASRPVEEAAARLAAPRSQVPGPAPTQPPLTPPTPEPFPQPEQPPLTPPTPEPLPLPEEPPLTPPMPSPLPTPLQPPLAGQGDHAEPDALLPDGTPQPITALPAAAYVPADGATPSDTSAPNANPVAAAVAEVEALRDESRLLARTTLDEVQQRIAQMNAMLAARAAQQNPDVQAQVREAVDDARVEDDLGKRRTRLSKP